MYSYQIIPETAKLEQKKLDAKHQRKWKQNFLDSNGELKQGIESCKCLQGKV